MSRLNTPGMGARPGNNVYTGMAFISMAITGAALGYILYRFHEMGII